MITAQEIKTQALSIGACSLIQSADSVADLAALLKTPQGREFYKKYKYPTIDVLRELKDELVDYDIYVDAGFIAISDQSDAIIAGDTYAVISVRATDKPYFVSVIAGAKAIVNGYGYSVCLVDVLGGNAEIRQYDNSKITLNRYEE